MATSSTSVPNYHWTFNPGAELSSNKEVLFCPNFGYPKRNNRLTFLRNLTTLLKQSHQNDITWKGIDFQNLNYMDEDDVEQVLEIVRLCALNGIKLLNVDMRFPIDDHDECILSVQNISWNFQNFLAKNLPNLESITLNSESTAWGVLQPQDLILRKTWPNLKALSLTLKDTVSHLDASAFQEPLLTAVELLVDSEIRPGVQLLQIHFKKQEDRYTGQRKCLTFPGIIKASSITNNFLNLKTLSIVGWDVEDLAFVHLWSGLPMLEILRIEDCSSASDVAFIGENPSQPAFLNLKNLKKFHLNLENMPLVTKRFLAEVLLKMTIEEVSINPYPTRHIA